MRNAYYFQTNLAVVPISDASIDLATIGRKTGSKIGNATEGVFIDDVVDLLLLGGFAGGIKL